MVRQRNRSQQQKLRYINFRCALSVYLIVFRLKPFYINNSDFTQFNQTNWIHTPIMKSTLKCFPKQKLAPTLMFVNPDRAVSNCEWHYKKPHIRLMMFDVSWNSASNIARGMVITITNSVVLVLFIGTKWRTNLMIIQRSCIITFLGVNRYDKSFPFNMK